MPERYAVMGNPIAHSQSPRIHSLFAQQTGEDLVYEAILVPTDGFAEAVTRFRREGGKGLNVTVPFKQEAWALADEHAPRAARAGAVNTLSFLQDNRIRGDNTDGVGLLRDLTVNNGASLRDKQLLILGAGGAVRGVLEPLLAEGPARVQIGNRTASKAVALAEDFTDLGPITGCGLDELAGQRFDLIINGTAAGLSGEVPTIPDDVLKPGGWCYDMMYGTQPTAFVRWAQTHGAEKALDGLGMLVEQAGESFYLWRGVRPQTQPVIAALLNG